MQKKILISLFVLGFCAVGTYARAALRRTPKIYNALITTDDNLTSSRAYPVIQPTIHETGIPHYPFGPYNAYGYYSPGVVRFGQPIVPGLAPREQLPYPLPNAQFPPQLMQQSSPHFPEEQQQQPESLAYPSALDAAAVPQELNEETLQPAPTVAVEQETEKELENAEQTEPAIQTPQQPVLPPKDKIQAPAYVPIDETKPVEMPKDQLPIALNEYGLPPSLIPLQQYPLTSAGNNRLPPYVFNQFPLLPGFYDPLTAFRDQYLPPYEYSASTAQTYAIANAMASQRRQLAQRAGPNDLPNEQLDTKPYEKENSLKKANAQIADDFENIKNVSKLKNQAVPDVPPPPLPSGAKTKNSS